MLFRSENYNLQFQVSTLFINYFLVHCFGAVLVGDHYFI